jgi:hypothetical protein
MYRQEGRLRDLTEEEWRAVMRPRWVSPVQQFAAAVAILAATTPAKAFDEIRTEKAFVITLNENDRYFRNSGTITLYDPYIEDRVLGSYRFVSGGAGSGALPLGRYEVGSYREDPGTSFTKDTPEFRRRWMIKQIGLEDGEALDPKGNKRALLELHSLHGSGVTAGCLGVAGTPAVWDEFVWNMRYIQQALGRILFEIEANPDGTREPRAERVIAAVRHSAKHKHAKRDKHEDTKVAAKHDKKTREVVKTAKRDKRTRVAQSKHKHRA